MTPFSWLFVAHLVGDMLLQTEHEAFNKATKWRPCLTHALKWTLALAAGAWLAGWRGDLGLATLLIAMGALHALTDRRWSVVWLVRHLKGVSGEPPGWLVMWVDQVLHVVQVAVLAALL